jgi:hypothetical protein
VQSRTLLPSSLRPHESADSVSGCANMQHTVSTATEHQSAHRTALCLGRLRSFGYCRYTLLCVRVLALVTHRSMLRSVSATVSAHAISCARHSDWSVHRTLNLPNTRGRVILRHHPASIAFVCTAAIASVGRRVSVAARHCRQHRLVLAYVQAARNAWVPQVRRSAPVLHMPQQQCEAPAGQARASQCVAWICKLSCDAVEDGRVPY